MISSQRRLTSAWTGSDSSQSSRRTRPAPSSAGGRQHGTEQPIDLLDAALVQTHLLHHLEQHHAVERHHRDGRAGLGDHRLQRDDAGGVRAEPATDGLAACAIDGVLGLAERGAAVDRPRELRADVGVVERAEAFGQQAGVSQRRRPTLPVLAPHHARWWRWLPRRGRGEFVSNTSTVSVSRVWTRTGSPSGLIAERWVDAGARIGADRGGHAVDQHVDLAELLADGRDHLGLHLVREGVAVEGDGSRPAALASASKARLMYTSRRWRSWSPSAPSRTRRRPCRRRRRTW